MNMPLSMTELLEAEAGNYAQAKQFIGNTFELLGDFDCAYERLTASMRFSGLYDPQTQEEQAFVSALFLFGFCRRQLAIGLSTLMRGYRADSAMHLRRAIEASAFAVRINKYPELAAVWANAWNEYEAYRSAFRPQEVFPHLKHPDYNPTICRLKKQYDFCSKMMHGGIFGIAGHYFKESSSESGAPPFAIEFFDLPADHSLLSSLFWIFDAHLSILQLASEIIRPYEPDSGATSNVRLNSIEAKLNVHRGAWIERLPAIKKALNEISRAQRD